MLVNPLHAETPVLPLQPARRTRRRRGCSGRRWRLRLEDAPEWTAPCAAAAARALKPDDPERIDRDAAWAAKRAALELMWPRHRVGALADVPRTGGEPLERFAAFCALAELHGLTGRSGRTRPVADPDRVAFWCWVQMLVDEQLAGIGDGLAIGVLHDLAVGVDAGGADAWALQDVLALGTSVGAPPDSFNQKGQDWGLPPWRPDRLREQAYEPFREMVRAVLRHAGGIRIDHVMGLSRLWWVPAGADASTRAPTSPYDASALLGILALEAHRAGAVIVGEDLGTVEPSVRAAARPHRRARQRGPVVRDQTDDGWYLPPRTWRRDALASVTTHDLPTAAGWLADEHVRVRHELGQLGHALEEEQASGSATTASGCSGCCAHEGLLAAGDGDVVVLALHRALVASPCRIVLAAYGDAVGDLPAAQPPGTVDQYPNWRLPWPTGRGGRWRSRSCSPTPVCAGSPRCCSRCAERRSLPCRAIAVRGTRTTDEGAP